MMAQPSNQAEIEGKFLDIDPRSIEKQLIALGAKREFKQLFKRFVFDYPDLSLHKKKAWLRVRDEGHRITMTYKQRLGVTKGNEDEGMREIEVKVSDLEGTSEILKAVGLEVKFYEENWRTQYRLDDVEICIDEWPLIPPYLEIESDSWSKVDTVAKQLGLNPKEKKICSTMQIYRHYGIEEMRYAVLTHDRQELRQR